MTKGEFAQLLDVIQELEKETREAGQKEYAHVDDNCHNNFDRIAALYAGCPVTPEIVLMIYLEKHLDGIRAYVKGHKSQREGVDGRLKDARLYLALLWGMVERADAPTEQMSLPLVPQERSDDPHSLLRGKLSNGRRAV